MRRNQNPASASTVIAVLMFGLFLAMWLFQLCLICVSTRTYTAVPVVSSLCINTNVHSCSSCVFSVYQHERTQLFQLCVLFVSTRTNTAVPIVSSLCINTKEHSCSSCVFSVYQHEWTQLFQLCLLCVSTRTNIAVPFLCSLYINTKERSCSNLCSLCINTKEHSCSSCVFSVYQHERTQLLAEHCYDLQDSRKEEVSL